jgi:hypothetical protein
MKRFIICISLRMKWSDFPKAEQDRWGAAMDLVDAGRKMIKGHDLKFYIDTMCEIRERSLARFKKRDDAWLTTVDKDWGWGADELIIASDSTCVSVNRKQKAL